MKLSIVVPIYNVEKFLPECLESLANQTCQDFHAYLINDDTPDNSGKIAEEFAAKHKNFTYIHEDNKGLGGARNTGLNRAETPYVVFIDSDDFVGPRYVENIYKKLEELGDFDIGLTLPAIYDMQTNNYWDYMDAEIVETIFKDEKVLNSKKAPEVFSIEANVPRAVWNVEFLRKNNFAFEEKIKWEDVEPHFTLFHKAERIAFLDFSGGYYYRVNSGGGQITSLTGKPRLDMIHVYSKALEIGQNSNWSDLEYAHFLRVMVLYTMWTLNVIDEEFRKEFVIGMSKVYKGIKLKHYRLYHGLEMPYRPYNKRYIVARCMRSSLFRHIFYKRKTTDNLHKLWKKVRGK